jgi:hypothetical protein
VSLLLAVTGAMPLLLVCSALISAMVLLMRALIVGLRHLIYIMVQ